MKVFISRRDRISGATASVKLLCTPGSGQLLSDADGAFVQLAVQDRAAWDRARIAEGQALLRVCLEWNRPGPYQLQAAVNAVHCDARVADETDWRQILAIYDQLMSIAPSDVGSSRCWSVLPFTTKRSSRPSLS